MKINRLCYCGQRAKLTAAAIGYFFILGYSLVSAQQLSFTVMDGSAKHPYRCPNGPIVPAGEAKDYVKQAASFSPNDRHVMFDIYGPGSTAADWFVLLQDFAEAQVQPIALHNGEIKLEKLSLVHPDKGAAVFGIVSPKDPGKDARFKAPDGTSVDGVNIEPVIAEAARLHASEKRPIEIQLFDSASALDVITLLKLFAKYKVEDLTITPAPETAGISVRIEKFTTGATR